MINLDDYTVNENNVAKLVNIESGFILNPFVSYKGWNTIEELTNAVLPEPSLNAKFYRKKNIQLCKTLHKTSELEIIDISLFDDVAKEYNGKVEQYIGDGEIITELSYSVKEDSQTFLKRIIKELEASYKFYSAKGYEKRFSIEGMSDDECIAFTKIVLSNALVLINYLKATKYE